MTSDVKERIKEMGLEYIFCSFVEMSGTPKAKLVPATHLEEMISEGAAFAGFAAGEIGQGPHDPDIISMPDLDGLIVLPWRKNVAWVVKHFSMERSRILLRSTACRTLAL